VAGGADEIDRAPAGILVVGEKIEDERDPNPGPLMHRLPPQILGSMEIRSRRGFTLLPRMRPPTVLPQLNESI
jgi:hypothetical protein